MNVNFGLFPPIEAASRTADGKRLRGPEKAAAKKRALTGRAKAELGCGSEKARSQQRSEA